EGREDAPGAGSDGDRGALSEDERLTARRVDVSGEDLRLPGPATHVAHEEIAGLERRRRRGADGPLGRLPHHEFERLITPEEHLLRVAVRARIRELALEAQEDTEPALVASRGDVGGDAHEVDGAVHR